MRTMAVMFLAGCGLLAVLAVDRAAGPEVDQDTPVRVLTTDPIRVILPIDPAEDVVLSRLISSLRRQAQAATSPDMGRDLRAIAADVEPLAEVASNVARQFADHEAAAVALAMYEVTVSDTSVVISAVTVEVIPQYSGIGISIDHENGHALINDEIVLACGPAIVHKLGAKGLRGVSLERSTRAELWRVGDLAHGRYHRAISSTAVTLHRPHASKAAAEVVGAECS